MKRLALTLCTAVIALFGLSAQAEAANWKYCGKWDGTGAWGYPPGSGFGYFNVRALNVSCLTARRIVRAQRHWDFEMDPDMGAHGGGISYGEGRLSRWLCEYRFALPESTRTRCLAHGLRRVKWVSAA